MKGTENVKERKRDETRIKYNLRMIKWELKIYIVKTKAGQPRPKYISKKCGTNNYFLYSVRFRASTLNLKFSLKNL